MSGLLPRLRKRSAACFDPSEASKTFKQLVSAFPSPRKPSSNLFWPFRALENLQATCFGLSDASETFKQLVSAFPSPRKSSNNLFGPFRPLGASGTPAKFAGYGFFLRYPASFPAPAGAVRDVCQVCRVRVFLGTRPASLPRQGPSGTPAKFAGYGFFWGTRLASLPRQGPRHCLPATAPRDERVNHSKAPEPSTCEGPGASFSKQLPRPL